MTQKLHQKRRPRQNDGPEIRHLGGRFFFGVGNFWKFSRNKAVTRRKVFLESLQCLSGNLGKGQVTGVTGLQGLRILAVGLQGHRGVTGVTGLQGLRILELGLQGHTGGHRGVWGGFYRKWGGGSIEMYSDVF